MITQHRLSLEEQNRFLAGWNPPPCNSWVPGFSDLFFTFHFIDTNEWVLVRFVP